MADVSQQKEVGVRIVHRVGKDEYSKPVIVSETLIRQGEKEKIDSAKGKSEIFDRASGQKKPRDGRTIYGELEIRLEEARKGIKDGRILSKEEFGGLLALVKETPDGKSWEMGLMVGKMIVDASEEKNKAEKIWQELADNKIKPDQGKKLRKENSGIAMVYDYIVYYGGDPKTIKWQNVLDLGEAIEAIETDKNTPDPILDRLAERAPRQVSRGESVAEYAARIKKIKDKIKVKEKIKLGEKDGWESKEKKLRAFENMLGMEKEVQGVSARGFWEKQLFEIVGNRLEAMRSPTTTKLAKDGKRMEIVQSGWDKLLGRARLASRLSFEMLDPGSEMGEFLNRFGALDYWRGKAAIDRMWSLYTGIPIESAEVRAARPAGEGLFSVLTKENVNAAEVNECCGPEAELQISKDDKTCDALNVLYHLAEGKTYQDSLLELKDFFLKKYKVDIDLKKDLPSFVKDAVMIAYFYGLDIRANGKKDARYKSWLVGEHESIDWVTDVNGNRINLLGDAFALKPDDMVERGWYSGRNASLAFNAITGDSELYDPKKQGHRTEKWQSVFFYTLGLDRDNKRVRHYDVDPSVPDDSNILPGTMGKFERFNNKNPDHRRALFDRLTNVAKEDLSEKKPSWDNDLRARVDGVLNFFTNPTNGLGTNNEVWFDPATMSKLPIWRDLNLVLEDPRAWGLIGDFRDSEMQHRTQNTRYTQHNSLLYDCAAVESAGLLVKILKKIPNTLPEEMEVFPAQIMEAGLEMRHRYNSELTFRNLNILLATTSQQAIERFMQVQIPSRDLIQKMLGEYKLFEWKRIYEGVKGLPINGVIERSAGIEFFLRQIEEELAITETGLVSRFDDAIKMTVDLLVLTEAFDWPTERDLFMNKRAMVYQYMSSWLNPHRPVEGYRVPVAITQPDGSIKIRKLCVSDLTYREVFGWKAADAGYMKQLGEDKERIKDPEEKKRKLIKPPGDDLSEFFTPMTKEEVGQAYGGLLAVQINGPAAAKFDLGEEIYLLGQDGGQAEAYGKKLGGKDGEFTREIIDISNLQTVSHKVNGWQRPGEIMLEGGRAVYNIKSGWEWAQGKWEFKREAGSRFKFMEGKGGYSRVWEEMKGGLTENSEAWRKRAVVQETKEVRIPCLKMTEDQAQKFFLHRYEILFQLLTGRAHKGDKPGQAMIDLDPYYENESASIQKLIRSVKDLDLAVNQVQMKQALRGIVMKGEHLSYEFIAVNKWAKEAYAIAKGKEMTGDIEHGQEKQIIEAADAIRKEALNVLKLHWLGKTVLWANEYLVWKKINIPAVVVTGLALWGVDLAAGTSVIGLLSNLMLAAKAPILVSTVLPSLAVIIPIYILSLNWWDKGPMLSIVRKINNLKAPAFMDYFNKYFKPEDNKEDAYFPAQ